MRKTLLCLCAAGVALSSFYCEEKAQAASTPLFSLFNIDADGHMAEAAHLPDISAETISKASYCNNNFVYIDSSHQLHAFSTATGKTIKSPAGTFTDVHCSVGNSLYLINSAGQLKAYSVVSSLSDENTQLSKAADDHTVTVLKSKLGKQNSARFVASNAASDTMVEADTGNIYSSTETLPRLSFYRQNITSIVGNEGVSIIMVGNGRIVAFNPATGVTYALPTDVSETQIKQVVAVGHYFLVLDDSGNIKGLELATSYLRSVPLADMQKEKPEFFAHLPSSGISALTEQAALDFSGKVLPFGPASQLKASLEKATTFDRQADGLIVIDNTAYRTQTTSTPRAFGKIILLASIALLMIAGAFWYFSTRQESQTTQLGKVFS